jgi:nickel superoxide dismutase
MNLFKPYITNPSGDWMNERKPFLKIVIEGLDKIIGIEKAYAHCDIPCGIYDPHIAQLAAHTVLRMDMLIADLAKANDTTAEGGNRMIRYTTVKEQHAELCKHEIRVLWGDYFKPEHVNANPKLHELVWNTLKLASKAKQSTNIDDAKALLAGVQTIAEIFWKTKGVETIKAKSFYPSGETFVYPKAQA